MVRKMTESKDEYSFDVQIPKMVDAFLNAKVIDNDYAREMKGLVTTAIQVMDNAIYNISEYSKSTDSRNNFSYYVNKVDDLHRALNTYFQRLRTLYGRLSKLDDSDARYGEKIEDMQDDIEEDTKEFRFQVYSY